MIIVIQTGEHIHVHLSLKCFENNHQNPQKKEMINLQKKISNICSPYGTSAGSVLEMLDRQLKTRKFATLIEEGFY